MKNVSTSHAERLHGLSDRRGLPTFCALIINPSSGGYKKEIVADAVAALERSGLAVELIVTDSPWETESSARLICERHEQPLIIAGGGDGTINAVINGLTPGSTLAVLPLGTSNVLAAELEITSIEDAVARIIRGKTSPLSVGHLDNGVRQRYFFLMAGIGVDGSVVEKVGTICKKFLGKWAYFLSALRHFLFWEREKLTLAAEGTEQEFHSVIVCNAAHYGGVLQLAPGADISSSSFEVVCIKDDRRRTYLKLAVNVLTGKRIFNEELVRLTCQDVTISGRKAIQIDGDFFGHSPAIIKMVSEYARIVV